MQFRNLPFALALLLLSSGLIPAQTIVESNIPGAGFDEPTSDAPTIQVFSRETIVDVLVTNDKGQPVRGLSRSDFTITEDGHPQSIRSFAEHSKEEAPPPQRTLPSNTFSNANTLPANGPVQIFYFILPPPNCLDGSLRQGAILVRARKYIADYFRTMPPGTQVAIFAFLPDRGLHLVQGFTTDGDRAADAVDQIVVQRCGSGGGADPLAAANQIAAYVAGIHGRKNLIWFGAPLMITRDGGYSWGASDMTQVHRRMDTYDLYTREQIAIYPFDISGAVDLGWGNLRAEEVAEATGGAAIYNTNDFKSAVAKIVEDTSHYYTLSYIPPRPNDDGHYHSIKIATSRPGLHLVYRGGYNDEHPAPPDAVLKVHMTQSSMGLGALPSTQLLFNLQVTPSQTSDQRSGPLPARAANRHLLPASAGKAPAAYDLLYKLDQTQIAFAVSKDGVHTASLEFDLAAYNADGKLITVRSQTLKLPLTPAEYLDFIQIPFQFYLAIDLPPGALTLRAGVFDGNTNRAGTIEVPLTVAKSDAIRAR